MKKVLALLMATILVFSLAACKSNGEDLSNGSAPTTAITENDDFKAPDKYAVVLLASINPQIKLYLDKDGIVIALEAVNDDAKKIANDIVFDGADYKTVIKLFISVANTNGFIKDDATIDFEIIEAKDSEINTKEILDAASAAATNAASELKITLNVDVIGDVESEEKPDNDGSSNTATENDNDKNESSSSTGNPPSTTHTHSYSKATCTEAAKCSCGATNGKALGHDWKSADCKAPKTCKTCGTTEGSKGNHNYSDGKCTVCGTTNILNPKTNIKLEKEYVANVYFPDVDSCIYAPGVAFYNDGGYGEGIYCVMLSASFTPHPDEDISHRTPIKHNGTNYYRFGAGQSPAYVELTDTEIIITQGTDTVKMILMNDGNLKITHSTISDFPVDTIMSISWNGLS